MNYKVYMLADQEGPFWIGTTVQSLEARILQHGTDKHGTAYFRTKRAIQTKFLLSKVFASFDNENEALRLEGALIKCFKPIGLLNKAIFDKFVGTKRSALACSLQVQHTNMIIKDNAGRIFNSLKEAAAYYNVSEATVSKNANGKVNKTLSKRTKKTKFYNRKYINFTWESQNETIN